MKVKSLPQLVLKPVKRDVFLLLFYIRHANGYAICSVKPRQM